MGENNSPNFVIHAYKDTDGSMVPVDYDHANNTFREFMDFVMFENHTGINIADIPEWPNAPVSTIYDVPAGTIEGISAGKYHVFTDHFSELDNDYRITGEGSVDNLSVEQIASLDSLTPLANS